MREREADMYCLLALKPTVADIAIDTAIDTATADTDTNTKKPPFIDI